MTYYILESLGLLLHVFVLQYEGRELVHPIGRGLYGIGQFARHDVALEVARTVEHVARSLDKGVVGLHLLSAQPAFGTHTVHKTVD